MVQVRRTSRRPPARASADTALHAADIETLERRVVELALERTGAAHGGLFLWSPKTETLSADFHIVDGKVVSLPGAKLRRRADRPNGIAFHVLDRGEPYVCADSRADPLYARYFVDVLSIAAVPVPWQGRVIGVLSVSSREADAFNAAHVMELQTVATSSAKFLRRAQVFRSSRDRGGRPALVKGLSPEWLEVERRVERVAATDAPVLVHGESGTGKELIANSIHENSRRAGRPFVTVNCAAIPETMLESILFGHVRGAFTGASFEKVGEFQKAHRGTLFLDEIGELAVPLQAKVLRAIELGEVQPLGSNDAPRRVDVRLVCATHRDLGAMMRTGRFRDDLYYRLSVMTIELPPLRSYKHDNLEVLAEVFLRQAADRHGRASPRLSADALALLGAYEFPGNVRELKNAIEHALIMSTGDEIVGTDLPRAISQPAVGAARAVAQPTSSPVAYALAPIAPPSFVTDGASGWPAARELPILGEPPGQAGSATSSLPADQAASSTRPLAPLREQREAWLAPLEARYLRDLLLATKGNVREAARRSGVDAVTLYRLFRRRGIRVAREVAS